MFPRISGRCPSHWIITIPHYLKMWRNTKSDGVTLEAQLQLRVKFQLGDELTDGIIDQLDSCDINQHSGRKREISDIYIYIYIQIYLYLCIYIFYDIKKPSPKKGFSRKVPKLETPPLPVIPSKHFLEHLSRFFDLCTTFLSRIVQISLG